MHQNRIAIEILPPLVVEKIAAGEVIERPASVLKEIMENAIDAGANQIDAVLDIAGFSLIKVADNGWGMEEADLAKSVLRHATSKIRSADDLFAVTTMGFRGEALASIAAVSRLTITSAAGGSGLGHELKSEGGVHGPTNPAAHAQGTTIEVRDLFYNVPARRKFMKSQRSEQLAAVRAVEQLSVPFPSIQFTLTVDGKRVLDLPAVATPLERIASIAGAEFAKRLIECRNGREGMEVACYVSSPEEHDRRPRFQSLYVNLRRVDSDPVIYAVRAAFEQFLSGQYRPSFFCFLDIDPSMIDVNVHPTKQQIRFEDERAIFSFIFSAVKQGIHGSLVAATDVAGGRARPERVDAAAGVAAQDAEPLQERLHLSSAVPPTRFSVDRGEGEERVAGAEAVRPGEGAGEASPLHGIAAEGREGATFIPFPAPPKTVEKEVDRSGDSSIQLSKDQGDRAAAWDLISCFQIHETYILAPIKNGILLIDQHAAHERVLFEQALEDISRGRSPSQQLLFPAVIELTSIEKAVVMSGTSFFTAFGFEVSDFGGCTVSVSAIPFFMRPGEVDDTVRSMVRYLLDEKERDAVQETEKRFAAAFACGAAIKAGQKLTQEEMNALVNSLFAAKNPYICPHGRPTLVRMSLEELSRRFLRNT